MYSKIIFLVILFALIYVLIYRWKTNYDDSVYEYDAHLSKYNPKSNIADQYSEQYRYDYLDRTLEDDDTVYDSLSSWNSSGSGSSASKSNMNKFIEPGSNSAEHFEASGIGNPVIDQGTMENAYALLSQPLTSGGLDSMSHRLIVNQISNIEFIALITEIKDIIASKIIDRAKTCQDMHGTEDKLGDGKQTLTLACETDPYELQDEIIASIYELLYDYIKKRFNIHLNPYIVYHDLYRTLNLMEAVIYPLQYSGLYTVHGVQYTTERWIRNKVQNDINVGDTLFTTISRRNIDIEIDTDQHKN